MAPGGEFDVRRERIVAAAKGVFLRYGRARATMGDIAEAAKISRPALYLAFPGKDDIFAAVIRQLSDEKLLHLRAALPKLRTFERRLQYCCENWGAHGFDIVQTHPDAKDLFDLSYAAVREMYAAFEDFLVELLAQPARASNIQASPAKLARNLVYAMRGFKEAAADGAEMRRMIALEVRTLCLALQPA